MRSDEPRYRSKQHLQKISEQPCLVCGRGDVQAHHLTLSQPQAMALKVGDQFAVPLCIFHHTELHRITEKKFWEKNDSIDPYGRAKKYWKETCRELGHPTVRSKQDNTKTKDGSPMVSLKISTPQEKPVRTAYDQDKDDIPF